MPKYTNAEIKNLVKRCVRCDEEFRPHKGKKFDSYKWDRRQFCKQLCAVIYTKENFQHGPQIRDPQSRFWPKVDKTPGHGPWGDCWVWTAGVSAGYGSFNMGKAFKEAGNNKIIGAHVASVIFDGRNPKGMVVCHKCDNPPCARPDHLFIGTHKDNTNDMLSKGRETRFAAKLTEEQVLAIRQDKRPARVIAEDYGITTIHAGLIRRKVYWKNLP